MNMNRDRFYLAITFGICLVVLSAGIWAVTDSWALLILFITPMAFAAKPMITTRKPVRIFAGSFAVAAVTLTYWYVRKLLG